MKPDKDLCCIGFKHIGLMPGEEVQIMKGVKLEAVPDRVTVIREYPTWVLFDMQFIHRSFLLGAETNHIHIGVTKGSLLCGDTLIKRKMTGLILSGSEVGVYGWV